jgi:hypothetical protein
MNSKFILYLAFVLNGIFATQRAYSYGVEIQINHANLKTDYSFLKIKTVCLNFTNNPVVVFTVIVVPKNKQYNYSIIPENKHYSYSGTLEISDANSGSNGYIAQTSVQARKLPRGQVIEEIPKALRDKCVVFEFGVAVKYLATSEFRVEEIYGEFDDAPQDYIFNLKEFAEEK